MIHALIVIAIVLLILWAFGALVVHVAGGLIHLLWIAILVLAVLWLLGMFRRRSSV